MLTATRRPGSAAPQIHAIRLEDSTDLMLAFNDHQKYADDGFTRFRTALRLAISQDHGATWTRVAQASSWPTSPVLPCRPRRAEFGR